MNLKSKIPVSLKYFLKAIPTFSYDFYRFYKYSGLNSTKKESSLVALIIHDYHVIEKGLTMPETQLGFGKAKMFILISSCKDYIKRFGYNHEQVKHAVKVILEYKNLHDKLGFKLDEELINELQSLKNIANETSPSVQISITKSDYFSHTSSSFLEFSNSRKSVRNYSEKNLSIDKIINAVALARNTPSACNRQPSKVYVYTNKDKIKEILDVQGGNRGFGHLTNKLIVIAADQSVFFGINERYQTYVDGGMFAMNLLYALHHEKILGCILNCSHTDKKDKQMREVCPINKSEVYIAMIACGEAPEQFKIAQSYRNSLEKYVKVF
ncbi:MAG: nitroreductase family protein [Lutibacter sp.]|uniref:nitroreductase family protein n=1 Tax=Lutibacter sp. TaxID=1925666 RepID=UPI0017D11131|nr:nitroreductase family protein [Lutibacter sp.]MBT8318065.1 nitroreductase family protein [Lutibacter sp.]NNJ58925.1 nitroreductase family protein [Lutibacter sp.]